MTNVVEQAVDVKKIFNIKHIITTLAIVIIVVWVLQKVGKQTITLYDNAGKESGRGEVKYTMTGLKKK